MAILVAGASEMASIDSYTINTLGVPGIVLMENAGRAVTGVLVSRFDLDGASRVLVFCGPGNNGGDGFVVARGLAARGIPHRVFLTWPVERLSGDAALNAAIYQRSGGTVVEIGEDDDLLSVKEEIGLCAAVVDSLFGTGLGRDIGGVTARLIETLNLAAAPVLSVDIPSGVHGTTGRVMGCAVRADITVTMGLPKLGHFLYPGAAYRGDLYVAEIGLSPSHLRSGLGAEILEAGDIEKIIPARPPDAHKGMCGKALILAGSPGFAGAAALASLSALRAGAGLVRLASPSSLLPGIEAGITEVVKVPLPEGAPGVPSGKAWAAIEPFLADCDALAVGPGLGAADEALSIARRLVESAEVPVVLDADGLRILRKGIAHSSPLVITPHPGEMARTMEIGIEEVKSDPLGVARRCSERFDSIVVLKGSHTIVAIPGGQVYINTTGNAGMASAGMGDVLTGAIVAIAAQGAPAGYAAVSGVYLHGLAGDMAAAHKGLRGIVARDVQESLPEALDAILTGADEIRKPFFSI
jgi:NAD(P)H-hydrate epimerase